MALSVTHSTVVVTPDDGTSEVGSNEWNATHTISGTLPAANVTPAGSDKQIQFNDGGALGADAGWTWDKTTNTMVIHTVADDTDFRRQQFGVYSLFSTDNIGSPDTHPWEIGGSYAVVQIQRGDADEPTKCLHLASAGGAPWMLFTRAGEALNPSNKGTDLVDGDQLMRIECMGSNNASWDGAAMIRASVQGTPTASSFPCRLEFYSTTNSNVGHQQRMYFNPDGINEMIYVAPSATTDVHNSIKCTFQTFGTPAAGIGASISYNVQTGAFGTTEIGVLLEAVTTDVTDTSEDFDWVVKTMTAGAAASRKMRVASTGNVQVFRGANDDTNYERLALNNAAGYFEVAAETGGTGTDNIDLRLTPAGTGSVRPTGRTIDELVTLTDGANITLNSALGNTFKVITEGNRTIDAPTNAVGAGLVQKIVILHEASGAARTLSLATGAGAFRFGDTVTGLSATNDGDVDYIGCIWNQADDRWDVVSYVKGYA
jgi:hypothetical protein